MGISELIIIVVSFAICIGLFLVFRFVALWYFRINEMIELLTEIRDSLKKLNLKDKEDK